MSKADQMMKKRKSRLVVRTVVLALLASAIIYTIAQEFSRYFESWRCGARF